MLFENNLRCHPPLPEAELKAIAESVSKYAPGDVTVEVVPVIKKLIDVTTRRVQWLWPIDPLTAFCGSTGSHKNTEVRGLLAPVAQLAAKHDVAVVSVSHLHKGDGRAVYRILGSLAFVAAAHAVWLVTKDANDEERRLFTQEKNNLAVRQTSTATCLFRRCEKAAVRTGPTQFLIPKWSESWLAMQTSKRRCSTTAKLIESNEIRLLKVWTSS